LPFRDVSKREGISPTGIQAATNPEGAFLTPERTPEQMANELAFVIAVDSSEGFCVDGGVIAKIHSAKEYWTEEKVLERAEEREIERRRKYL
jgi:hypothetical protein